MTPKRLFKFFKQKSHAEEFVLGRIRIGKISVYKTIEDQRKDENEGTSYFVWDQPAPECVIDKKSQSIIGWRSSSTEKINFGSTLINSIYLLCTSSLRANKRNVSAKFGKYYVEICYPYRFLELLKQCWMKYDCSLEGKVELKKVKYDRGNIVKPNRYLIAPTDISYTQKSGIYRDECEYRFVFWCKIDPDNNLKEYEWLNVDNSDDVIKKKVLMIS